MGMMPDDFFNIFVIENYEDFTEKEDSIRRGFNAVVATFHLADHYYNYCQRHAANKISKYNSREHYLKYLAKKNKYFNDIQSIANAYKHLYQRNSKAPHVTVSSAGTIEIIKSSDIEIEGDCQEYVVYKNIKSGEIIRLSTALKSVIDMWREELSDLF